MDTETLAGIVHECFPDVRVRSVARLQEGWASFVIEVNGELIFRFPKRPEVVDNLRKEIRLLPRLASHLPFRVPRFDYVWEGGRAYDGWFVGYRKIEGAPIGRWCTRGKHSAGMVSELAALLTEVHRFPAARFPDLRLDFVGPRERKAKLKDLYEQVQHRVLPILREKEQDRVVGFFEERLADADNFRFETAFTHDDLSGPHILCDRAGDKISGVIDWEDGCIGDPAGDFYGILQDCGLSFTQRVLDQYEGATDPRMIQRVQLYLNLVPFYEILYGLDFDKADLAYGLNHLRSRLLR